MTGLRIDSSQQVPANYLSNQYYLALQSESARGETKVYIDFSAQPTQEIVENIELYPTIATWQEGQPVKEVIGNSIVFTCPESAPSAGGYDIEINGSYISITYYGSAPHETFGVYSGHTKVWPT